MIKRPLWQTAARLSSIRRRAPWRRLAAIRRQACRGDGACHRIPAPASHAWRASIFLYAETTACPPAYVRL